MNKCPRCKKEAREVGHYARDYTSLCSECFAEAFVDSLSSKVIVSSSKARKRSAKSASDAHTGRGTND